MRVHVRAVVWKKRLGVGADYNNTKIMCVGGCSLYLGDDCKVFLRNSFAVRSHCKMPILQCLLFTTIL